ncbi:MAG: YHS domain-containing protein [Bergeyella sp.]|nr:YHS domain-containing protein [Bergeyella sp.]
MNIDPVCKMEVDENAKYSAIYKNSIYRFCSESCKNEFIKSPSSFIKDKNQ